MHKTFSFKFYRSKKNRHLHRHIEIAAGIWNRCIALHRRYYRLYGKHLNKHRLQKHLTKLKQLPRFRHWSDLGSQAIQDIADRIDRAYTFFFRNRKAGIKSAPPGFKSRRRYRSFTLKQAGWTLLGGNRVRVGKHVFRFSKSREIEGKVKTVTIKRDTSGDLYLFLCCEVECQPNRRVMSGQIAGADFGLKVFLTFSNGSKEVSPLFYREESKAIRRAGRELSSKQKGSNNRQKARMTLARVHKRIADKRRDHHFKLARELALRYDYLFLENLNLKGMQRLWGKKVGDLGFARFIRILHHQSSKAGTVVHHTDRWFPSSKKCSACGAINETLNLKDRCWQCACGAVHDRDHNAALNILREGASSLGLDNVRPFGAVAV